MTERLIEALRRIALARHRWWRRRQVERLARRLGASRRQAARIAHHTP
jgi:hypothetical protein